MLSMIKHFERIQVKSQQNIQANILANKHENIEKILKFLNTNKSFQCLNENLMIQVFQLLVNNPSYLWQQNKAISLVIIEAATKYEKIDSIMFVECSFIQNILVTIKENKWKNIQWLYLQHCNMSNQSVSILVEFDWPCFGYLILGDCLLDQKSGSIIAKGRWPRLKMLILSYNALKDQGSESLTFGQWPELSSLFLDSNKLSGSIFSMQPKFNWKLKALELNKNHLSRKSVKEIVLCKFPLEFLKLNKCNIDDEGLIELSKGEWINLFEIKISENNNLSNRGLRHFTQANWPSLETCEISCYQNNLEIIKMMLKCNWGQKIQKMKLTLHINDHLLAQYITKISYQIRRIQTKIIKH